MREDLYAIAVSFRSAIEEAVHDGKLREMVTFPRGCCSFASDLLQRHLFEQSIFTWYMSGEYGYGWDAESHAWLEAEDGTVIDITGDQYRFNEKLLFSDSVYVGPRDDGFHNKFELDKPIAYEISNDPFGRNREFDKRYEIVKGYLR